MTPARIDPEPLLVLVGRAILSASRHWPLALALYLPGLLLGFLSALPVYAGALGISETGTWIDRSLAGGYPNVLVDVLAAASHARLVGENAPPLAQEATRAFLAGAAVAVLAVFVQGLIYNGMVGGILARLDPEKPRSFWSSCREWGWPMLRIGLLGAVLAIALVVVVLALAVSLAGPASVPMGLLLAGLILAYFNGALELARADAVARDDRRAARTLARAMTLSGRGRVLAAVPPVWLLLTLLGALVVGVQGGLLVAVPAGALAPAFLVAQLGALLGAWTKLLRLAFAVELARR